ncbi:UNVERIFIED_CONTAM: hypothetical protein FKN15_036203 [Acipenser sinensis]
MSHSLSGANSHTLHSAAPYKSTSLPLMLNSSRGEPCLSGCLQVIQQSVFFSILLLEQREREGKKTDKTTMRQHS